MNWNWLRRRPDPGICECGCRKAVHEHWHPEDTHCGPCGTPGKDNPNGCGRYKPDYKVTSLTAVCADDELIEDVLHGNVDQALTKASPDFVALLLALKDIGRAA